MKLVKLGRWLALPEGLVDAKIGTIDLQAERRFKLHAGDEREASLKRAEEVGNDSRRTREAVYMILCP